MLDVDHVAAHVDVANPQRPAIPWHGCDLVCEIAECEMSSGMFVPSGLKTRATRTDAPVVSA